MKKTMKVTSRSVGRAGITRHAPDAIKQYLWNAIEADATAIEINYARMADGLKALRHFWIEDNGTGINYDELSSAFGSFLDSTKQTRFTKGGKGKGRLSFMCFASTAIWYTTYSGKDSNLFYPITINESKRQEYEYEEPKPVQDHTGTKVEFRLLKENLDVDYLDSEDFVRDLSLEFGWYLQINKDKNLTITINGKLLDHSKYIEAFDSRQITIVDKSDENRTATFRASYIQWVEKIGTDSYFYFLDSHQQLKERTATGFNKIGGRAYGFIHSVYVESDYFDKFSFSKTKDETTSEIGLQGVDYDQHDNIYKQLIPELKKFIAEKRDAFLAEDSEGAIERFRDRKTLPEFGEDTIGRQQEENYIEVLKGVYKTAPTLFIDMSQQQEKSLLGLLNITLKSDEREHVLDIISSIVELTPESRRDLAEVLRKTRLSGVIKLLKTLESRYAVVEILRELVFKHAKTTTERGQLQEAIENNFWLFGEEYAMVSADTSFKELEETYLNMINRKALTDVEKNARRPDLFLCRQRNVSSGLSGLGYKKQNLVVELKRPSVNVGTEQFRQIEDYRDIIRNNPNLNSTIREWHMFIIGAKVDKEVAAKREAFKHLGRQFLVSNEDNFYIYALSWDDVFTSFEIRHDFLLEDLQIDKNKIKQEIELKLELNTPQALTELAVEAGSGQLAAREMSDKQLVTEFD